MARVELKIDPVSPSDGRSASFSRPGMLGYPSTVLVGAAGRGVGTVVVCRSGWFDSGKACGREDKDGCGLEVRESENAFTVVITNAVTTTVATTGLCHLTGFECFPTFTSSRSYLLTQRDETYID